ncbi:endoglucanase, partial [Pseudomonas sp. HMWF010]
MSLRTLLRSGVAAVCIASVAVPSVQAAGPVAVARGGLIVRVAQAAEFSRVEFLGGGRMTARREGQVLTLRFSRDANPDMTVLGLSPPRWVKSAQARHV